LNINGNHCIDVITETPVNLCRYYEKVVTLASLGGSVQGRNGVDCPSSTPAANTDTWTVRFAAENGAVAWTVGVYLQLNGADFFQIIAALPLTGDAAGSPYDCFHEGAPAANTLAYNGTCEVATICP
jgi:hypothetical protein